MPTYLIARTKGFEKSYRRIKRSGKLKKQAEKRLKQAITLLAFGKKLSIDYGDHQLTGRFAPYRECHIRGDLLLVYQIRKDKLVLILINIGTHSYFGL